ncbi:hypothetical protein AWB99_20160 [Mycolicibacterium confluentis]|uniref:Uncharacterized protein n=1 Tax=Mycolicibacterium confluentis TaxID=28047 RepID=A0A7I7XUD2_9MYCO|nr:hypothetical protein AWB99_20160 [Mycolicibacterium confluentis]BBZ32724.1 hypothetical protein MCNF_13290 [Mycolicibacterium confluentis]
MAFSVINRGERMKRRTMQGMAEVVVVLGAGAVGSRGGGGRGLFSGTYVVAQFGDSVLVALEFPEGDAVGTGLEARRQKLDWQLAGNERRRSPAAGRAPALRQRWPAATCGS